MKQGLKLGLPIQFSDELNLANAATVKIKFYQMGASKIFTYSGSNSDTVTRDGNTITTIWTKDDTYLFKPGSLMIDAVVTMNDGTQPETSIARVEMHPTLFTKLEV